MTLRTLATLGRLSLAAVWLVLAGAPSAAALPMAGRVVGTITDDETGETLPGANIRVVGTSIGAAADFEGNYAIASVPAGPQTLIFSYSGFVADTVSVTVVDGETVRVDAALSYQELGEVTVTAQVAGQLGAINEQFSGATITNIVSRDRIQELPDNNAAESIGRVPGVSIQRSGGEATQVAIRGLSPRFNTVTVNGVRLPSTGNDRSVDLSLISSNILDGIEVRKAITPDQDADAIGGSVDLRLRNAPSGFTADLLAQGGYTGLQDYYGNYKVVGSVSNRLVGGRLGAIATFNTDRYDRSADRANINYAQRANDTGNDEIGVSRLSGFNTNEENNLRTRAGGSLLLDYAIPMGRVTGNAFYNAISNEGLNRSYNPNESNVGSSVRSFDNRTSILTSGLGVDQDVGWIRYDAQFSYTNSRSRNPNDYLWEFGADRDAFGVSDVSTNRIGIDPDSAFALVLANEDSTAALTSILVDTRRLDEDQSAFQLNLQAPFRLGTWLTGFLKTGTRLRWLERSYDQNRTGRSGLRYPGTTFQCLNAALGPEWEGRLNPLGGPFPIREILLAYDREGSFLGGRFGLGPVADDAQLLELTRALQSTGCADEYVSNSISSLGQDYDGTERYEAGYVMGQFNVGRYLTLIPGVRYEHDHSVYNGQRLREVINALRDGPPADLANLNVERDNSFWLPMLHMDVRPTDWLSLRLARTETLTRPSYDQYAPITSIDGYRSYIRAAASTLRPAQATNYDATVQVVQSNVGLVGVSAFRKRITDLAFYVETPTRLTVAAGDTTVIGVPEGTNVPNAWLIGASPTLGTFINNDAPTTFYGFEFEWQTNFSYLPGAFRGLVLNLNYTRTFSEATYRSTRQTRTYVPNSRPPRYEYANVDTTRTGRMPDQAAHIANATLGWDYRGFSTRLSYLFQSNTTAGVSLLEPLEDTFVGPYSRFDLSVRQKVRAGFEVFANVNNLNNRSDRRFTAQDSYAPGYEFNQNFLSNQERYGYTVDLGARYRF